ncbi:unnamed protein product [Phyllotreta striolata]|uniref:Lipase n=1 Tax=Phyllotreta striolata TaxID=444603 RepID=A0A9N9XJ39_PHYSR|nr:unnamed protein product [Phyllotreta striolata]
MLIIGVLTLKLIVCVSTANVNRNNVCSTFSAYGNISRDKRCFYNPDLDSNPAEIAQIHGYALETHLATTEDGYIISIFRLKKNEDQKVFGQPVVLQHGILVDSLSWIISGNNSLGFHLVSNGFDVWLPNFRGSTFSGKHVNPSISEKKYWNFSFHELGVYDIPAIVEKVAKITLRNDIVFLGHSMGSTTSLIYPSMKPKHAEKYIKGFIYTAPVAHFDHTKGAVSAVLPFYGLIKNLLESFRVYAIGTLPKLQSFVTGLTCGNYPNILICQIVYSFSTGLVVQQVRPDILPVIMKFFPTGTAVKCLMHYAQIALAKGRFQQFDYGIEENKKIYNSPVPPEYDVGKITVPSEVFASKNDFLTDYEDVTRLYNELKCPKNMHTYDLGHTDYLYGKNVNELYNGIVQAIKSFDLNKSNKIIT